MPAEEEPAAMDGREAADGSPQQFCLRWNNYQTNLANCFDQLLQTESFVDVTLACEGQSLKAHKVVLSACSPYFQTLFMDNPCRHPIIIMRDIKYCDLKAVVDFMYRGEINVSQDQITALLKVAETLKIRGLTDVSGEHAVLRAGGGVEARAAKRPGSRDAGSPGGPGIVGKARRPSGERSPGPSPRASPAGPPDMHVPPDAPSALHAEDVDIRPGIAEMIREEERAKLLENSHAWLGASTSSIAEFHGHTLKLKAPTWTQSQLQEAIQAVVTQKMRFTQAATHYGIPKGTLYDNILGKSKRMAVLDDAGLSAGEERAVLDFCCETSVSPYNRRTKKSLAEVLAFVEKLRRSRDPGFAFIGLTGFRWWWAFSDSYQYQLQSMWQKCWNTNQSLVHNLRFRERGPLKSWRPETMAEAIFSVLKEGLSLSQAARKYDIPYPTFVLYANRVHNMLGPSADGGADLRPKGRGRPQRILLGVWPEEHIRGVIRAVVFRDSHTPHSTHHIKEEVLPVYPSITDGMTVQNAYPVSCGNGREGGVSPNAAAAAAVAAVAHGLRRQMCNMVVAAQRPPDHPPHLGLPPLPLQSPRMPSPLSAGLESPLCSPPPPGLALEPPKPADPFRPFASPRPDSRYSERDVVAEITEMGPPKTPVSLAKNGKDMSTPLPVKMEPPPAEARAESI